MRAHVQYPRLKLFFGEKRSRDEIDKGRFGKKVVTILGVGGVEGGMGCPLLYCFCFPLTVRTHVHERSMMRRSRSLLFETRMPFFSIKFISHSDMGRGSLGVSCLCVWFHLHGMGVGVYENYVFFF